MVEAQGIAVLSQTILIISVIIVAFFDLRERRIPNFVVFPLAFFGLAVNSLNGWNGFFVALKGLSLGFGILFIPYLIKVLGAGDVKFLAAIGAVVGSSEIIRISLLAILIYPLIAILFVIHQGKLKLTIHRFAKLLARGFGFLIPQFKIYADQLEITDDPKQTSATSPFGLTLSVGVIISFATNFLK